MPLCAKPCKILTVLALLVLRLLSYNLSAQTQFEVIEISGKVLNPFSQKPYSIGDKALNWHSIKIENENDHITLYSPFYGRKYCAKNPQLTHNSHTNLAQKVPETNLSILIDTLRDIFKGGNFLVFGEYAGIDVFIESDLMRRPLEQARFYVSILWQKDTIFKPLPFNDNPITDYWDYHLLLSKQLIYSDTSDLAIPQQKVHFVPKLYASFYDSDLVLIDNFNPVFIDDESLVKKEVLNIIYTYRNQSKSEIYKHVVSHLKRNYAPPIEANLKEWLKTQLNFEL